MSAVFLSSVYQFPNFEVRSFEVLTHKPSIAAYRAPTAPHTFFAIDAQMQQMADALGQDTRRVPPAASMQQGDPMANGPPWESNGAKQVLQRMSEHPLWKTREEWKASGGKDGHGLRGVGLAVGGWIPGSGARGRHGAAQSGRHPSRDHGPGGHRGHQHRAGPDRGDRLRHDIERVKITTGDTDSAPLAGLSAASKTIYTVGTAVMQAAQDARRQVLEIAAKEMEAAVEDLEIEDGTVVVRGVPDKGVTVASIGKKGHTNASKTPIVLGSARPTFARQAPAFAAELARVEIDPDTGQVTLCDFVVVQDAGKAINPIAIEGQMQGGAVQSLGIALSEGFMYNDKGRLMNASLLDYRQMTAADLPNIETIIIEVPRRRVRSAPAESASRRSFRRPPRCPTRSSTRPGADHGAADHSGAHRARPERALARGVILLACHAL